MAIDVLPGQGLPGEVIRSRDTPSCDHLYGIGSDIVIRGNGAWHQGISMAKGDTGMIWAGNGSRMALPLPQGGSDGDGDGSI